MKRPRHVFRVLLGLPEAAVQDTDQTVGQTPQRLAVGLATPAERIVGKGTGLVPFLCIGMRAAGERPAEEGEATERASR